MTLRMLVGDRTGRVIGEMMPAIESFVVRLNEIGEARFTVGRRAAEFREDWLRPGNRVYVEFDNGLPAWGGVIDLPREWSAAGVTMTAYGIEALLQYRITGKSRYFDTTPAGAIFAAVLREMEWHAPVGLEFDGPIWVGGAPHYPRYHFKAVWWILTESLRKIEVCDFRFVPLLVNGEIRFRPEFYQILGDDKRASVALWEGANVMEVQLSEQGPLVNYAVTVGQGTTWGDERETATAWDVGSQQIYGLREASVTAPSVSQAATLVSQVERTIRELAYPHTRVAVTVANVSPGTFGQYQVGDIVRLVAPSLGFSGYDAAVRVLAREYAPATGRCALVVEEWVEPEPITGEGETA